MHFFRFRLVFVYSCVSVNYAAESGFEDLDQKVGIILLAGSLC